MSLVAYGSSDESDSEDNNDDLTNDLSNNINANDRADKDTDNALKKLPTENVNNGINVVENQLFSNLPTPKNTFSIPDNTFRLLNKKSQPVKIVLPSLNEIKKSTDEDEVKKRKPSTKGSGLFALLPAPKNSKSLIPDSVKKKVEPKKHVPMKPLIPSHVKKALPSPLNATSKKVSNDDDEEDDLSSDKPESFFFTSTDDVQPDPIEPIELPGLASKNSQPDSSLNPGNSSVENHHYNSFGSVSGVEDTSSSAESQIQFENSMEVSDLDQEALEKLCGSRARKRKGEMPEEIIDINVDSMVGDAYMWLSKDLTKEQEHGHFKKPKNLSVVERRKHQITYLASQAKEKEMELRNQWANSRMTRKQTQSKYGF